MIMISEVSPHQFLCVKSQAEFIYMYCESCNVIMIDEAQHIVGRFYLLLAGGLQPVPKPGQFHNHQIPGCTKYYHQHAPSLYQDWTIGFLSQKKKLHFSLFRLLFYALNKLDKLKLINQIPSR